MHFQLHKWPCRQTAISTDVSKHSLSSVLHGATHCGFWDGEGFHESSHTVTPRCGYTEEWCSAFGPHWFLMNHRCCFAFTTSHIWPVDSPFSVEWIFGYFFLQVPKVRSLCQGFLFLRKLHQMGFTPQVSGFSSTRLFWWHIARSFGVRLWQQQLKTMALTPTAVKFCIWPWKRWQRIMEISCLCSDSCCLGVLSVKRTHSRRYT